MDPIGLTALFCVIVLIVETSAGVLTSLCVIIIILLNFHKKNNVRTGNKIRLALSLSNVCFSIITCASVFSGFFWPMIPRASSATCMLYSLTMYCISSCSWLSAGLSFFYFIKIVNVKIRCLVWMKTNISSIVSWLILVVELMASGSFFLVYFLSVPVAAGNTSVSLYSVASVSDVKQHFIHIVIVVTFFPLLTVFITTITTAVVLKQHRLKIEQNMGPSSNVNLGTYKSAIFRMVRLLLFYTMFYTVLLIFYLPVFVEMSPGFWVSLIIMSAFTPVQSILLILGNPQLKRGWKELTKAPCLRLCVWSA